VNTEREGDEMGRAQNQSYEIETLVNGTQEWQDEPITAGVNYVTGDELTEVAKDLAEVALENTSWHTMPRTIEVRILSDDEYRSELATYVLHVDPAVESGRQWVQ
jgi:hypothetical protein